MSTPADERRRPGRPARPVGRGELIALARDAFAERGFDGTSMAHLAELADLRKASLFHHFSTKEALYHAVLDEQVGDLRALVQDAQLDRGDFADRLDRLGRLVVRYFTAHRASAVLLMRELMGGGRYIEGPGGSAVQATLELTAAFLSAGMEAGAFRPQDARQLTLSIVGLHLYCFATPGISGAFLGRDLAEPALVAAREDAVVAHVRALCLALPPGPPTPAGG